MRPRLNESLSAQASAIAQALSQGGEEMVRALDDKAGAIAATLDGPSWNSRSASSNISTRFPANSTRAGARRRQFATRTREIDQTLGLHAGDIYAALDREVGSTRRRCSAGRTAESGDLVAQATEDLDATLAGRAGEIGDALAGPASTRSASHWRTGCPRSKPRSPAAVSTCKTPWRNARSELRDLFDTRGRALSRTCRSAAARSPRK